MAPGCIVLHAVSETPRSHPELGLGTPTEAPPSDRLVVVGAPVMVVGRWSGRNGVHLCTPLMRIYNDQVNIKCLHSYAKSKKFAKKISSRFDG